MTPLLLFMAHPVEVVRVLPELPKLTPEMRTDPIYEYDCRLIGQSGADFGLIFRREGGQGYYSAPIDGVRPEMADKTPVIYRIVGDGDGRFSKMEFDRFGKHYQVGSIFRDNRGSVAVFRAARDEASNTGTMSVYFYENGSTEPAFYAGPCEIEQIGQLPLDTDPKANQ